MRRSRAARRSPALIPQARARLATPHHEPSIFKLKHEIKFTKPNNKVLGVCVKCHVRSLLGNRGAEHSDTRSLHSLIVSCFYMDVASSWYRLLFNFCVVY